MDEYCLRSLTQFHSVPRGLIIAKLGLKISKNVGSTCLEVSLSGKCWTLSAELHDPLDLLLALQQLSGGDPRSKLSTSFDRWSLDVDVGVDFRSLESNFFLGSDDVTAVVGADGGVDVDVSVVVDGLWDFGRSSDAFC